MATIDDIPSRWRSRAERIPAGVLSELDAVTATARCIASERIFNTAMSHSDPVASRAALLLSEQVLRAPLASVAEDYRVSALATNDPVLRAGYEEKAREIELCQPTSEDIGQARQELAAWRDNGERTTQQPVADTDPLAELINPAAKAARTRRTATRVRAGMATASAVTQLVNAEVAKVKAQMDRRAAALEAEIHATRAKIAQDAEATTSEPMMLYKGQSVGSSVLAERYRRLASEVDDPVAAAGYRALANRAEKEGR